MFINVLFWTESQPLQNFCKRLIWQLEKASYYVRCAICSFILEWTNFVFLWGDNRSGPLKGRWRVFPTPPARYLKSKLRTRADILPPTPARGVDLQDADLSRFQYCPV